jgi:hypothetical protein
VRAAYPENVTARHVLTACTAAVALAALPVADAHADFLSAGPYRSDQAVAGTPTIAPPALGASFTDPVFGTRVWRLTRVPEPGAGSAPGIVPEYSKAQAFNADQTRLLLRDTDGATLLYDARTPRLLGRLPIPEGDVEPRWSPRDPDRLTYLLGDSVYAYSLRKHVSRRLARFRALGPLSSGAEQEPSADGRYFAVHGPITERGGRYVSTRAFVVDLRRGRRGPIRTLHPPTPGDFLDYVAITPDGDGVMVMWARHGADLYTRSWRHVRRLTDWDEHADFCREGLVIAHYRPGPNDETVELVPLDGSPRRLLWRAPVFNLALHVSCRNTRLPGWVFLSSYWDGAGQRPGPTPLENEVFALSTASTPERPVLRRLAHTEMTERLDYFDEPHATVRQDGRIVLFASNFGRHPEAEGYDDTYAIDLR